MVSEEVDWSAAGPPGGLYELAKAEVMCEGRRKCVLGSRWLLKQAGRNQTKSASNAVFI